MFEFFRRRKANGLLVRAHEAYRKGDRAAAARLLEQVMEVGTKHAETAIVLLATAAREDGDLAAACRHLERARALLPEEGKLALRLGDELRALGENGRAVAAYDAVFDCARRDGFLERRAIREAALAAFAMKAPDAESRLERAVASFGLDVEAWLALAQIRFAAGDREGARDALRQVLRNERDHLEAHERLLSWSDEAQSRALAALWRPEAPSSLAGEGALSAVLDQLRMNRAPEAAISTLVREAKASDVPGARALVAFVLLHAPRRAARFDEARALLDAADPSHPLVRFVSALFAIHEEREDDARALLEPLYTEGLPFPNMAYFLGVRYEVAREPARAEAFYREVLAADPDDAAVGLELASVLRQQARFTEAQEVELRAYATDPVLLSRREYHLTRVVADRRARARRRRAERRLKESPDDQEAQVELSHACNDLREYREALALATGLREEASGARGLAHFSVGELALAEREYRAWLRWTPADVEARADLGQVLSMRSRDAEGEALLDEAIRAAPHLFRAHATKGIILSKRGDRAAAEAEYREAMRCDPQDMAPHLNLGIDLLKDGRQLEAEREFRIATALAPDDVQSHLQHAKTLRELGRNAEAEAVQARAEALHDWEGVRGPNIYREAPVEPPPVHPWTPSVKAALAELAAELSVAKPQ